MSLQKTPSKNQSLMTPPGTLRGPKMIVDVSLDKQGKQHYALRNSPSSVPRPRPGAREGQLLDTNSAVTAAAVVSATIGTTPRKRAMSGSETAGIAGGNSSHAESGYGSGSLPTSCENSSSGCADQDSSSFGNNAKRAKRDNDIWSEDVEDAFCEALAIIPKQGLHKVKISGCARGRNELISDYILARTGKSRSRKQVSSHIQVIKNLRKDMHLVNLIINGPDTGPEVTETFDRVFSQISLQKSLGGAGSVGTPTEPLMAVPASPMTRRTTLSSTTPTRGNTFSRVNPRRRHTVGATASIMDAASSGALKEIKIAVENFAFNYVNLRDPQDAHKFSSLSVDPMKPPLRIRTNADLSFRFPRFFELVESIQQRVPPMDNLSVPPIPIMHGMVKLATPSMTQDMTEGDFDVSTCVTLSKLPTCDERFCCLTLIYSFGRFIISTFEQLDAKVSRHGGFHDMTTEIRLGTNYWKEFFSGLRRLLVTDATDKTEYQLLSRAIKGVTMKQVVFSVPAQEFSNMDPSVYDLDTIQRESIRSIMLWEFLKVDSTAEAVTTLRRIHLPMDQSAAPTSKPHRIPINAYRSVRPRAASRFSMPIKDRRARSLRQPLYSAPPPPMTLELAAAKDSRNVPVQMPASPDKVIPQPMSAGEAMGLPFDFELGQLHGIDGTSNVVDAPLTTDASGLPFEMSPTAPQISTPQQNTHEVSSAPELDVTNTNPTPSEATGPFDTQYLYFGAAPSSDGTEEDPELSAAALAQTNNVAVGNMMAPAASAGAASTAAAAATAASSNTVTTMPPPSDAGLFNDGMSNFNLLW